MTERGQLRPRLNWFSPLPPARTDIGHYALRTLRALRAHADVIVWTEHSYWPLEFDELASVRRWDEASWRELNAGDVTLYHLGNNIRFHGWIWNVARRHAGVVVLHDTHLHEFFAPQFLEAPDGERVYLDAVRRCHGEEGVRQAERLLQGDATANVLAASLPMTALALERARGAVVHTQAAFEQLAALGRCPVLQLDLPYEAGPPAAARRWDGVLRLVVFGYLGANRRLDAVLDAIATFPDRRALHLDVVGHVERPDALTARVEALGLGDLVQQRGFVPEAELDALLDRCHLAVNLRYPTMGEASGSQLRIWSRGLASLVSRTGWYAELPAEAVWFVEPSREIEDLHDHFRRALADPAALEQAGLAGRCLLEERHSPASYAEQLVQGVMRMTRTPVSLVDDTIATVNRVVEASAMPGSVSEGLARRAADEVCRWSATPSAPEV